MDPATTIGLALLAAAFGALTKVLWGADTVPAPPAPPALPPPAAPPTCCEDAAGGAMVHAGEGVWLCVWCLREKRLAAAAAIVKTCAQCAHAATKLPELEARAIDEFHRLRHRWSPLCTRCNDNGCPACCYSAPAPAVAPRGGVQYHSREPAPPPPPPPLPELATTVPRAVPPPGRPPAPPPNIRRFD